MSDKIRNVSEIMIFNKKSEVMLQKKTYDYGTIRIWSAGCSTGEEAYTLAMIARDCMELTGRTLNIKIFATDLDSDAIAYAGIGVYPESIAADIAPHYQLVVERQGVQDALKVEVEASASVEPTQAAYARLGEQVRHQIKSMIGITTRVIVKRPGEVPRSQGKAVRVRDERPKSG